MATSPTTKSALLSGAAKDDAVGQDGVFTFKISDLLANDPGGAAKVNVTTQFFFGDTAEDQADQAGYLATHGITNNGDGTYTINSDALDSFSYFVQIGNKGTWSQADVDVTAPAPAPEKVVGDLLFREDFDSYADVDNLSYGSWETVNLTNGPATGPSEDHSWAIKDENGQWAGVTGEVVHSNIDGISGDFWLDTQNSPGGIDISNWFVDPTGGEFRLSFDLGIHDFGDGPKAETAQNAMFNVLVDGKLVDTIDYSEVLAKAGGVVEQMGHFEYVVDGGDASAGHTISFVDATPPVDGGNYVGFALDTIQVHDYWTV